jgi:hypothetical protein
MLNQPTPDSYDAANAINEDTRSFDISPRNSILSMANKAWQKQLLNG